MDNNEELQEFSLDDILKEFHDQPDEAVPESDPDLSALVKELVEVKIRDISELPPEMTAPDPVPPAAESEEAGIEAAPAAAAEEAQAPAEAVSEPVSEEPTVRVDAMPRKEQPQTAGEEPTQKLEAAAQQEQEKEVQKPKIISFDRRGRLLELKKKLIAGPEKMYYDLSEEGVGKLQLAIIVSFLVLAVSAAASAMFVMGMIPENRMKLFLFSQVLALLLSGLIGSYLMVDGLSDLLHLRFSPNTILVFTFLACGADAFLCLRDLRIPCCAAFSLEMTMALIARYHKRSTEMAQLDTMRKASRLISIVKEPEYYEGKTAILRGEGDVDDFLDTYKKLTGPELVQNVFCFVALVVSTGIAVLAGILHNSPEMGMQILAASLLVAVPASYFTALTRPAALLEKRLHMVGTVICGWRGVKKLCKKALFPLTDSDLFPAGSAKLNGIKFYSNRSPEQVVSYTASLILSAGGGLVGVFRSLLISRSGRELPVQNFRDYGSGGIGGIVGGESVLLGSLNFLQDMGVEIPKGTTVNQAVYAAIDGQLVAVVAISYAKMRSAAAGLISLCGCRKTKPILLAGDFMLTEEFIRSKFSVSARKVAMPDRETRAALLKKTPNPDADVLALATREDLVSSAYAVTGACALRTACNVGSFIHMVGGIMGMVIMLAAAYLGATELLTPTNLLLYQLLWLIPGFLATEWTRHV